MAPVGRANLSPSVDVSSSSSMPFLPPPPFFIYLSPFRVGPDSTPLPVNIPVDAEFSTDMNG